jgi:hypothetical protein
MTLMNRRDALKSVVLLMGGTVIGSTALLTGCAPDSQLKELALSAEDLAFLDEIGETIIPTTDTPGAKATKIGEFMQMMVKECYDADQQTTFINGLTTIRTDFKAEKSVEFMDATPEDRLAFLNALHQKYVASGEEKKPEIIHMLRDLTVLGYYSSEIGSTQALRYVETPGRFDPCIDYKKGDKAWA